MSRLNAKTILVVEDDPLIGLTIAAELEDCGARVIGPIRTVIEALNVLNQEQIDAALLDVELADRDSYPIAVRLQSAGIPFVFVTSVNPAMMPSEYIRLALPKMPSIKRVVQILFSEEP